MLNFMWDPGIHSVESRGPVTIHDIFVAHFAVPKRIRDNTPGIEALELKKSQLERALARYEKAVHFIETFMKKPVGEEVGELYRAYKVVSGVFGTVG